jgi:hypothetical protein
MASYSLPVSNTLLGLGASVNFGSTQTNINRTYTLNSNNTTLAALAAGTAAGQNAQGSGSIADAVAILVSSDNFVTDSAVLGVVSASGGLVAAEGSSGNAGNATNLAGVYQYARTMRLSIANIGSPSCVSYVNDAVPSTGGGTFGVVANGGQALGINWVVGPTDAFSFSLVAHNVTFLTSTSAGNVSLGETGGTTSTTVQAGSGGIGIGVAAPGSSDVNVDTSVAGTGTLNLGATNAGSVNVGNATNAATTIVQSNAGGLTELLTGSGGQVEIGGSGAGFTGTADSVQIRTLNSGPIVAQSAGSGAVTVNSVTGDVNIGTGTAGADTNAKIIRVGTGLAAKTLIMGSSNTSSTTTISYGTGGCGIGVSAPGSSGIAIDTPVAGAITVGATNATSLALTGAALATITIGTTTLATAITIGNATAGTIGTLNGPWAMGVVAISNGTGAFGSAATTVNVASFFTINSTAATQTFTVPNPTGAAAVAGRRITVQNIGTTNTFTISGVTLPVSASNSQSALDLVWDNTNSRWVLFST